MIVLYLSSGEAAKSYPFSFRNKRSEMSAARLLRITEWMIFRKSIAMGGSEFSYVRFWLRVVVGTLGPRQG